MKNFIKIFLIFITLIASVNYVHSQDSKGEPIQSATDKSSLDPDFQKMLNDSKNAGDQDSSLKNDVVIKSTPNESSNDQKQNSSSRNTNIELLSANNFWIYIGLLCLFPILVFAIRDSIHRVSNGCRKIREVPLFWSILELGYIGCTAYLLSEVSGLIESLKVIALAAPLFIFITIVFVNNAIGYVYDPSEEVLIVPGYTKEPDSFLSYLNPFFILMFMRRVKIPVNTIRATDQWVDTEMKTDSKGNVSVSRTHSLNISTSDASYVAKFSSASSCDRLNSLINDIT